MKRLKMLPAELRNNLKDRYWRLNNLYWIKSDEGNKPVKFRMRPEQYDNYTNAHTRNVILKARQLGFTTAWMIILLDCALFEHGSCALIAHKLDDAKRLFREKAKFAYDRLPKAIKAANPAKTDRTDELTFAKGGYLSVSNSFRGGTLTRLHVSEFGKICAKYPDKAREIVTGAFEAVSADCTITLESTAEGREGYFYDYCSAAEKLAIQGVKLSKLDFKFFFYPWWNKPSYRLQSDAELPAKLLPYFDQLEVKHGIRLDREQKLWYASKWTQLGEDMWREHPSFPAEAFQVALHGAYYAQQFRELYAKGRIGALPDNSHQPVYTFWDIGVSDSTAIWFVRVVGEEFHVIDYYENSGEGLRHYMKVIKDKGYRYAEHWGPHDIDNREFGSDAKSRRKIAAEGYEIDGQKYSLKFNVIPSGSVNGGIESVREVLPRCAFDEAKCADGIKALEHYRKEWNEKTGSWKDRPLHDWSSHGSDAFRAFGVWVQNRRKAVAATGLRMPF